MHQAHMIWLLICYDSQDLFIIKSVKCVKPMLSLIAIFKVVGVCLHC